MGGESPPSRVLVGVQENQRVSKVEIYIAYIDASFCKGEDQARTKIYCR
jgi:hypothetical protein